MAVLIVGLGNPGAEYADTRHNVGWMALDAIAGKLGVAFGSSPWRAHAANVRYAGKDAVLLKPLTYMNLSGEAAAPAAGASGAENGQILAIFDEVQLPVGRVKLSTGGSDGGHNGVASLIETLGGGDFRRLRIGVGPAPKGGLKDFVLSPFAAGERELLAESIGLTADAALEWIRAGGDGRGFELVTARYNARELQPLVRREEAEKKAQQAAQDAKQAAASKVKPEQENGKAD